MTKTSKTAKTFPPSAEFRAQAHVSSETGAEGFRQTAELQSESFWKELARVIKFDEPFDQVLDWQMPRAQWFVNGTLNVAKNCIDKHLLTHPEKIAILWQGEPEEDVRRLSYKELFHLSCQIANGLKNLNVKLGDRVAIYMPMVPETVATMLACARLGAIHTVIFGGFSAQSIADRVKDCGAKVIVTATGTYRKGSYLSLKSIVDEALEKLSAESKEAAKIVEHVLVFDRDPEKPASHKKALYEKDRDLTWKDGVLNQDRYCEPVPLDSEHPLFILYTSGTTGKPKGLYHTQAGYLLWAHWSTRWVFDLKADDVYWCTADCGWITGHTYVAYGPLSNGATIFMYEGAPLYPENDRYWQIIEKHKISILYTAPTAIRTFMRFGNEPILKHDLSSLRLLGSVGEPINPEAWTWYHSQIGKDRCPIVDTWWQTETGGAMIAPFPGATDLKPGSATKPLPGVVAEVVNAETGVRCQDGERGVLIIRKPWPSMARGIWGDPERFEKTYWNTSPVFKGQYVTADFAVRDADGYIWVEGRMDDVLNVSGHRIGSAEVESALVSHPAIAEAAAVGVPDPIKGQAIAAFITLTDKVQTLVTAGKKDLVALKNELRAHVAGQIGAHAKPDQIRVASSMPKTRSGKIMRRLLRELASTGEIKGDTSTLEDFSPQAALESEN